MPADEVIAGSPGEWIARARADLSLAVAPLPPGAVYDDLCYHAQQAAEKAIKAVYLHLAWKFRYVHNIEELLTGFRVKGLEVPPNIDDAVILSDYAFEARYPRLGELITEQDRLTAVELAECVLRWAEKEIGAGS